MTKKLQQLKTSDDFLKYARKHGADICEGGNHTLVVNEKGKCALPRHKKELATGTRYSIIKTFLLMGLAVVIAFVILQVIAHGA